MALIDCPACDRQVSEAAVACPQCGHPIARQVAHRPTVQTVEQTGKVWKLWQVIGGLTMTVGSLYGMLFGYGIEVFFLGLVFYLSGRMGAWWSHG